MRTDLSPDDFSRWSVALGKLPTSRPDFLEWLDGPVRAFFPFQRLFCAHGEMVAGEIRLTHWLGLGHQPQALARMAETFVTQRRSSVAWWLAHRAPVLVDPLDPPSCVSRFELDEIADYELGNIAAHGVLNPKANAGTYFSFSGVIKPLSNWHAQALMLLAPVLHDFFVRLVAAAATSFADLSALTPRQLEIVRRLAEGLDDKTIAGQLDISEKTVRNQLSDAYRRLDIRKRTELLALIR